MQKYFNEGHERNVANSGLKICSALGDGGAAGPKFGKCKDSVTSRMSTSKSGRVFFPPLFNGLYFQKSERKNALKCLNFKAIGTL